MGNLRPFPRGVSGNPGGRPLGLGRYIREQLGDDGAEIAGYVIARFRTAKRHDERMAAATWLADRGWGRPVQAVSGPDGGALLSADLLRLQVVLVEALAPWPDARVAVAAALAALEDAGQDADPAGEGA